MYCTYSRITRVCNTKISLINRGVGLYASNSCFTPINHNFTTTIQRYKCHSDDRSVKTRALCSIHQDKGKNKYIVLLYSTHDFTQNNEIIMGKYPLIWWNSWNVVISHLTFVSVPLIGWNEVACIVGRCFDSVTLHNNFSWAGGQSFCPAIINGLSLDWSCCCKYWSDILSRLSE